MKYLSICIIVKFTLHSHNYKITFVWVVKCVLWLSLMHCYYWFLLSQSPTGTLRVTGYLRGKNISVNGLVHILGWGDFQMKQIDSKTDPYPLNPKSERQKVCNEKIARKDIGYFVISWLKPYWSVQKFLCRDITMTITVLLLKEKKSENHWLWEKVTKVHFM